jgi:xanthine dehydrogenase iron-sulfur cluster and FAD-binding subunit A
MLKKYISPNNLSDAVNILFQHRDHARIIAGATDLLLEIEKGMHENVEVLIDISRINGLDSIILDENSNIHLGPLATHNQSCSSKLIQEYALPLAKACWLVGSPQIRNRGTVAGNLITASPANDAIPALLSLNAGLVLLSKKGERKVPLGEFYKGVRKTVLEPDEILIDIIFPALKQNQHGNFYKLALRRAQAISLTNTSIVLTLDGSTIVESRILLGSVSPTVVRASKSEEYLKGKVLTEENIEEASQLISEAIHPITDIRTTNEYRKKTSEVIVRRCLLEIMHGEEKNNLPRQSINLWGKKKYQASKLDSTITHDSSSIIETTINGKKYDLRNSLDKTLLRSIREEANLTGTKEGCDEGECGACTIFMDGVAVNSCLVPAPRAHGANIVTIEGVSQDEQLHPVQVAFLEKDAVQCGYCTPGFIMSSIKLLEEEPNPTIDEIQQAITGNLCRCTGYYKIIQAIELAAKNAAGI